MRRAWKVVVLTVVGVMSAACAQPGGVATGRDQGSEPSPAVAAGLPSLVSTVARPEPASDSLTDEQVSGRRTQMEHAAAVLAAWDAAIASASSDTVITAHGSAFPGGLTQTGGDWSQIDDPESAGAAVAAGAFEYLPVPVDAPSSEVVQLSGGRTATVPIIDAETAVAAAHADGNGQNCNACSLTLVDPVLGSLPLTTIDGVVSVPAWDFTVAGTGAHVIRVAVNPDHLLTPGDVPDLSAVSGSGASSEVSTARVTGPASVTVEIFRSNPDCGGQIEVIPVETAHTFAVVVTQVGSTTMTTCDARAYPAIADVHLAAPIADRVMIDLSLRVPVVLER